MTFPIGSGRFAYNEYANAEVAGTLKEGERYNAIDCSTIAAFTQQFYFMETEFHF